MVAQVSGYFRPRSCDKLVLLDGFLALGTVMSHTDITFSKDLKAERVPNVIESPDVSGVVV